MRRPPSLSSTPRRQSESPASPADFRNRVAAASGFATLIAVAMAFLFSAGTQFLMPGPLANAHNSIAACSSCHANSGSGRLTWIKGLAGGDPHADSKACLTCHKMPETAFNAHGASAGILKDSTERLAKIALQVPAPAITRAQSAAFPTDGMRSAGLECATCHQEHQGATFDLGRISNEQCRSCHVVKFDTFDGRHPQFQNYPFRRRTRIVYDHAGHFGKHYPEVAKKDAGKTIPATCSTCHDPSADRRIMAVAPFDKTCATCHLDQIIGKERVSGPKGIAFLSLPGLDTETLKRKNADIGEWPEDSEAPLTPFMKTMISRSDRGGALLKALDGINLQDLASAGDAQIKAATGLVWEIKRLYYALISEKASDVFAGLGMGGDRKVSPALLADLTANIPRDVIVSAQQEWLPSLGKEMASRKEPAERQRSGALAPPLEYRTVVLASAITRPLAGTPRLEAFRLAQAEDAGRDGGEAALKRRLLPSGTPRSIEAQGKDDAEEPASSRARDTGSAAQSPTAESGAGPPGGAEAATATAPPASAPPAAGSGSQTDDLLSPTEAEQREIKALVKGTPPQGRAGPAVSGAPLPDAAAPPPAQPTAANSAEPAAEPDPPAVATAPSKGDSGIESSIDPESWAESGGWYRQDYAIYYRPAGHKDRFIYAWLSLTGPLAKRGEATPAVALFESLTGKDAQGSCTKCHSIDDLPGKGRAVNFSPATAASKTGKFTRFVHEPHFGLMEGRGCLGCHKLEKTRPYLKSYEQLNPLEPVSNFAAVKKDLCTTCHTASLARQDCLLCHKYHVNDVATPIMQTKIPVP